MKKHEIEERADEIESRKGHTSIYKYDEHERYEKLLELVIDIIADMPEDESN